MPLKTPSKAPLIMPAGSPRIPAAPKKRGLLVSPVKSVVATTTSLADLRTKATGIPTVVPNAKEASAVGRTANLPTPEPEDLAVLLLVVLPELSVVVAGAAVLEASEGAALSSAAAELAGKERAVMVAKNTEIFLRFISLFVPFLMIAGPSKLSPYDISVWD